MFRKPVKQEAIENRFADADDIVDGDIVVVFEFDIRSNHLTRKNKNKKWQKPSAKGMPDPIVINDGDYNTYKFRDVIKVVIQNTYLA